MSESQFAYGSFTLDELRSLAASPQVGTMQAMPQSFRALADRVGEVADLLSHAQADLPNWWKGPAANQAAASLGRAAAEAREFHDSAMGAATAVSRCAQVVAEQQNQMMNVPDAQEPSVSAVVQRPTTPFEALEAARQDAAYQAAHEQAVQVVNGIAAQYVETRSQLASIDFFRGENFSVPEFTSQLAESSPSPKNSSTTFTEAINKSSTPLSRKDARVASGAPNHSSAVTEEELPTRRQPLTYFLEPAETSAFPRRELFNSKNRRTLAPHAESNPALNIDPLAPSKAPEIVALSTELLGSKAPAKSPRPTVNEQQGVLADPARQTLEDGTASPAGTLESNRLNRDSSAIAAPKRVKSSNLNNRPDKAPKENGYPTALAGETEPPTPSTTDVTDSIRTEPTENSPHEDHNGSDLAIMPPYSGIGSVRSERDRRNPRPTYLKERKSAWLPDTFAAPPDGVITPDWLE